MENTRNGYVFFETSDDARRQFIDAQSVYTAWEDARRNQAEVRGGMYWKRRGEAEYLIRTSPSNAQKSLGPRTAETEKIYEKFVTRKEVIEARLDDLTKTLERHKRMNRALHVGRAPRIVVEILNRLAKSGLSEYFTVVGTHALYAYEAAAGVHIQDADAFATQDIDLLLDTRKRLSFVTQMTNLGSSMLAIIKKVDPTFEIRPDQKYTAVNSKGFEVDIIRREAAEGDPHPMRLTESEGDDFYAVQARRAGVLLDGPRFSAVIVAITGDMARMNTISPRAFVRFKRWMAEQEDRDPLRRRRDKLQADLVEDLVEEYLPHLNDK